MELYPESFDELRAPVERHFTVENVYLDAGILTFRVKETEIKERFRTLCRELRSLGYVPTATKDEGGVIIRIFPKPKVILPVPRVRALPAILFFATLGTVAADGFLRASSPIYALIMGRVTLLDRILEGVIFTVALMAIIGIHELGHKISAKLDYIESSPPYFIPGIPTVLPTFGAVIFQKSPLINRDDMFDMGFSGPVAGFLVSVGVAVAAYTGAQWFSLQEFQAVMERIREMGGLLLPPPLIFYLLRPLFGRPDMVPMFSTLGFAAWLGMLITALNLFPVWQLDGGRIFRSLLSRRQHRIASYVSIAVLAFTGYFFFALFLLLMMPRTPDVAPLDQVSPLSKGRKLGFTAVFAILILTFVPLQLPIAP